VTLDPRERVRLGGLRGPELLAWLGEHPPAERDAAIERLLGIGPAPTQVRRLDRNEERMPYMPSAIAPVVRAVLEVPITADDVFVDLGAGPGKVTMAVHLLTSARSRGVELQADLVTAGRAQVNELGLRDVSFVECDALDADLEDVTVVFLYLPFTGEVLAGVLRRLEAVARRRQIVICTLGLDLRGADWIAPRPTEEFWLSIYDSRIPGAEPRRAGAPSPLAGLGEAIASGRSL
jgi:precorrin-6B methylase 2